MSKFVLVKILKVNVFSRPLLERNYMRGSISIENILFSRNCDIKITNAKSATDASIWVMCVSINSYTLGIAEASLFNSPIIICRCGFHVRSTDLADKPQSLDSGSICKQTWIKTLWLSYFSLYQNVTRPYCIHLTKLKLTLNPINAFVIEISWLVAYAETREVSRLCILLI